MCEVEWSRNILNSLLVLIGKPFTITWDLSWHEARSLNAVPKVLCLLLFLRWLSSIPQVFPNINFQNKSSRNLIYSSTSKTSKRSINSDLLYLTCILNLNPRKLCISLYLLLLLWLHHKYQWIGMKMKMISSHPNILPSCQIFANSFAWEQHVVCHVSTWHRGMAWHGIAWHGGSGCSRSFHTNVVLPQDQPSARSGPGKPGESFSTSRLRSSRVPYVLSSDLILAIWTSTWYSESKDRLLGLV